MSNFLYDTFTGSAELNAHTSDSGHTWSAATGSAPEFGADPDITNFAPLSGGHLSIDAGSIFEAAAKSNATPTSADYIIECGFTADLAQRNYIVLCGRFDSGAGDAYEADILIDGSATAAVSIYKFVGGVYTALNSTTCTVSTDVIFSLNLAGSTQTVKVDGVTVLSEADSSISAAGGVMFDAQFKDGASAGTGYIDYILAGDIADFWTAFVKTAETA